MTSDTSQSPEQPSADDESVGGCSSCGRQIATPYKNENQPECAACYRRRKRAERGLKRPGPPADPSKPRSRYGEARKNEGTRNGVVGRPALDRCPNGHAYTPENTFYQEAEGYRGNLRRGCKICRRESQRRHKGQDPLGDKPVGTHNRNKTHCPQGHEYSEQNTSIRPDGSRACKKCKVWVHRKMAYGLTPADFDNLWDSQDGRCAICNKVLDVDFSREIHVDHCHLSGSVRGLLCHGCNVGLGNFKDSPEALRAAADYVETGGLNIPAVSP